MTRSGRVAQLWGHAPEPVVTLHPADLSRRGFAHGDIVRIDSRRGALHLPVAASDDVRPGQAFIPMHWGSRYLSGDGVNALTLSTYDPRSHQPELKHCAVRITTAELPWQAIAFGLPDDGDANALHNALQFMLERFTFASCTMTGGREGVVFRAAAETAPPSEWVAELHRLFALDADTSLCYEDRRHAVCRRVRLAGGHIAAVCLTGDTVGSTWLMEHFAHCEPAAARGPLLLAPTAHPPANVVMRGRTVYSCFNVGEAEIIRRLQSATGNVAAKITELQATLRCGTQCGSCLPELKRLVAVSAVAA